ncbi:uncharacterized protein LOC126265985 [Aethina tumida]|uniref:uncharacterized protein LOC126265985 n=1 Tax=Aethina tumida TaxID=116153 RepID=UPI0021486526|nr:uncharacterized protein LOC126265985 [Aethina tumida]
MLYFVAEIRPHTLVLDRIIKQIKDKFNEIILDIEHYSKRNKRGLINGIGAVWKTISGNLDASDGEYYDKCINQIEKDEKHIENLMKNQILITTSTIKNFNYTIQKLQIDEETFNNDIKIIDIMISNITDNMNLLEAKIKVFNLCEQLLESFIFINGELDDIINSITFAKINVVHPSVIQPLNLLDELSKINSELRKDSLPLDNTKENIPKFLNIIKLDTYQSNSKIIFVLNIPTVQLDSFKLYHLFSLPLKDDRTKLFHTILNSHKYLITSDFNRQYAVTNDIDKCQNIDTKTKICKNIVLYPVDNNAICEAQILMNPRKIPETCVVSTFDYQDYNVQPLNTNKWLIVTSNPISITITCANTPTEIEYTKTNVIIQLKPMCTGYIGEVKISSNYEKAESNYTDVIITPQIPFECCLHLPKQEKLPKLKPLKINKFNLDELKIAETKLNQYQDQLDDLINETIITKHWPWFTYLSVTINVTIIIIYIFCKIRRRRTIINRITSSNQPPPPPFGPTTRIQPLLSRSQRRRPSISRVRDPNIEQNELSEVIFNDNNSVKFVPV